MLIKRAVDDRVALDRLCDPETGLAAWRLLIAKDRALARAIATTALRHRGRIEQMLGHLLDRPLPKNARHLVHTLHAAAAQILFMEVPDRAAVDLAVTALAGERRSARFSALGNAILRRLSVEKEALLDRFPPDAAMFPDWLAKALRRDHGRDKLRLIAAAVAREPALDLTLKPGLGDTGRAELAEALAAIELPSGGLRLVSNRAVERLPFFEEGLWWVQDAAASLPARLLGEVGGLEVADLCAAPGGKTAQLASAGARVTAVDASPTRLARLAENLKRLRLEAQPVAADILEWQPGRRFDAVLLDAPCSATGTMRRHPDTIWTKTPEDVAALSRLQRRMIEAAAAMVEPGGRLVYANCSMLKAEGEDLIAGLVGADEEAVLSNGRRLHLEPIEPAELDGVAGSINRAGALRTLPYQLDMGDPALSGMDSFFACRFRVEQS